MEATKMKFTSLTVLALALVACGNGAAVPAAADASSSSPLSTVDDALAEAETGRDPAASRARLEALLADTSTIKEDRARVALGLARLVEGTDKERAITLTEQAVALGSEDADKHLFWLLTGKEEPSVWSRRQNPGPVPPSAKALAKYWPAATPDRAVEIEINAFGGLDNWEGGPKGTFDISSALREQAIQACGLCDEVKTKIHTHSSRESFWTSIPRSAGTLDHALVVIYVDEATIPPARYAKWLAAPVAAIEDAFARGEGLVAVKDRPSAPPLVTIAAPRFTQLAAVEAAFSEMATLPKEPTPVTLPEKLAPSEIRSAIRAHFGQFRACYEALEKTNPTASGTFELAYGIAADGATRDLKVTIPATLEDAAFRGCVEGVAGAIKYPAWSRDPKGVTTVRYPITVSP
jgi:hypothetical protein